MEGEISDEEWKRLRKLPAADVLRLIKDEMARAPEVIDRARRLREAINGLNGVAKEAAVLRMRVHQLREIHGLALQREARGERLDELFADLESLAHVTRRWRDST